MSAGALPPEFIIGSRRSSLIGCFSALCLHVSPFGAVCWGFVLSSLLGFIRVVCINMKRRRVARRTARVLGRGLHGSTGDATLADAYAL